MAFIGSESDLLTLEQRYRKVCQELHDVTAKRNELSLKLPSWVKVADRLPEPHVEVLGHWGAATDHHVVLYSPERGEWYRAMDRELWHDPTHWMPLPEPPK